MLCILNLVASDPTVQVTIFFLVGGGLLLLIIPLVPDGFELLLLLI